MNFKSDSQRKAVMCKLNSSDCSRGSGLKQIREANLVPKKSSISAESQVRMSNKRFTHYPIQKLREAPDYVLDSEKKLKQAKLDYEAYKRNRDKETYSFIEERHRYDRLYVAEYEYDKALLKFADDNKKDTDGDGVVNAKDCEPFNREKQGLLHKYQLGRLRRQEEELESQRQKLQDKLEDKKEILEGKLAVSRKKDSIRQAKLKSKQKIIDEINKEKAEVKKLTEENDRIQKELRKNSAIGKIEDVSKKTIQKTRDYFAKPQTKKSIKKIVKSIDKFLS